MADSVPQTDTQSLRGFLFLFNSKEKFMIYQRLLGPLCLLLQRSLSLHARVFDLTDKSAIRC